MKNLKRTVIIFIAVFALLLCLSACKKKDKHTHSPVKQYAVSATCEVAGNGEYWKCTGCGLVFSDEACTVPTTVAAQTIPPYGHRWSEADCETPKTCDVCGETSGTSKGHDWTKADCDTPKTCSVCGHTEGEADGHSWTDADCDTSKTCSVCGATEGEPLRHSYDRENLIWIWDTAADTPTCQLKLTCIHNSEHILTLDAEITAKITSPPTCKDGGEAEYTATVKYGGADHTDVKNVDLSSLDHMYDWENVEWVWAADLSSATLKLTCTLGDSHVDSFFVESVKQEALPSCVEDGSEIYTVTTEVMDRELCDVKEITIPATGHKYKYDCVTWGLSENGIAAVIKLVCENDQRHEYTDIANVSTSIIKEATCIKKGAERLTATIEYEGETYSCESDSEISAKGHYYEGDVCANCLKHKPSEGLTFEKLSDGSGYTVTGVGECTDEIISIPDEYEGLPVLGIGSNAFKNNTNITELYLSDNVTSVGDYAFYYCTSLVKIDLGVSVQTIGKYAFNGCSSLVSVTVPDSTEKIKDYAFYGCNAVRELKLGEGLTSIYRYAFGNMPLIREVYLSDSLNDIGDYAFMDCVSLTSLTIPKNVTYLPTSAFSGCIRLLEIKNLSKVTVTSAPTDRFFLKNVYTESSGNSKLYTDEDGFIIYEDGSECILLAYHGSDRSIVLPENINGKNYSLWHYCFYDVKFGDGQLYIPDAVTSIGGYAFYNNNTVMVVDGAEGVTSIDTYAFSGCSELLSFTFGKQLKTIGTNAFQNCPKLMDVINHSSLTLNAGTLGNNYAALNAYKVHTGEEDKCHIIFADDGCVYYLDSTACFLVGYNGNEVELVLPDSFMQVAYHIYKRAFYNNKNIARVSISSSTAVIGESAFEGCSSLTQITITGLAYVTKRIEDRAFLGTSLVSIKFPGTLEYLGADALPDTLVSAEFGDKEGWYYVRSGSSGTGFSVGDSFSDVNSQVAEYLLSMDGYYFYKKTEE